MISQLLDLQRRRRMPSETCVRTGPRSAFVPLGPRACWWLVTLWSIFGQQACADRSAVPPSSGDQDLRSSATSQVERLPLLDTLVAPDLSERTAWFQQPRSMHPGAAQSSMWTIERTGATLTEIDTTGSVVRRLARHGEGPKELENPVSLIDSGNLLVVLDPPALRIAAFTKDDRLAFEVPIAVRPSDFAARADTFFVVPGRERIIDVYSRNGPVRGVGPARTPELSCNTCHINLIDDGHVIVADPIEPQLLLVDVRSGSWHSIDLNNDVLSNWKAERQASMKDSGQPEAMFIKNWIGQLVFVGKRHAILLMLTHNPASMGTELWQVDLESGSIVRYSPSGHFIVSSTIIGDDLYGLLSSSRGILRFRLPSSYGE